MILTIAILQMTAFAQHAAMRFEGGGFLTGTFLREIGSSDHGTGTSAIGLGGRFVVHAVPHVDFETEFSLWPNNQATSGTWVQGLFGVKAGQRFRKVGMFAKVRPGFMYFRKDPYGASKGGPGLLQLNNWATSTEPSLDVGGVLEYYTERNLIVRFDLGDTVIHYSRRSVFQSQFLPPLERGGFTTHNWQGSFGIGFRF